MIPVLPEQVKAIPLIVIGSPTLKLCGFIVVTVATPVGSWYTTFVIVPTPDCTPFRNNLSRVSGVFSKTNLPSISIAASFGGISISLIILISLLLPVLLDSLL